MVSVLIEDGEKVFLSLENEKVPPGGLLLAPINALVKG